MVGADGFGKPVAPAGVIPTPVHLVSLGAPDTADVNGVAEAQNADEDAFLDLDGDLVVNGVAVLDVPRNLVADSGGADTAVLVITGTDVYGNVMVENITLNGTTAVAGKKAFKTVTSIQATGAAIANSAFVGTGTVLGLPVFLPEEGYVLAELEDGDDASSGTIAEGVITTPTATTGDVRGTYDPNSAPDGDLAFALLVALPDPENKGINQFAG
jgi:hypothetical protein